MRSWPDMGLRRGDFARISLSLSARHLKPTCFWDPRAPVHQQLRPSVIRRVNWPESRSCICTTLRHTGNTLAVKTGGRCASGWSAWDPAQRCRTMGRSGSGIPALPAGRPLWCPVSAISECSPPEAVLWDELSNVSGLRFLDR